MEQFFLPILLTFVKSLVKEVVAAVAKKLSSRDKGRTAPLPRDGSDEK